LERDFERLEESLILLHILKINHNDIKTNNIVYSENFKKLVLLDFGLSEVNDVGLGYMKLELPKGSIDYCCDDMKKLFFDNFSQGLVDLYYNDMIALEKS
jgi:tRNA A-37 threonylcarbamoyl transferase component Bud32